MSDEKRIERKVNSTTDVQEACAIGYESGYKAGYKAALDDLMRMLKGQGEGGENE